VRVCIQLIVTSSPFVAKLAHSLPKLFAYTCYFKVHWTDKLHPR